MQCHTPHRPWSFREWGISIICHLMITTRSLSPLQLALGQVCQGDDSETNRCQHTSPLHTCQCLPSKATFFSSNPPYACLHVCITITFSHDVCTPYDSPSAISLPGLVAPLKKSVFFLRLCFFITARNWSIHIHQVLAYFIKFYEWEQSLGRNWQIQGIVWEKKEDQSRITTPICIPNPFQTTPFSPLLCAKKC